MWARNRQGLGFGQRYCITHRQKKQRQSYRVLPGVRVSQVICLTCPGASSCTLCPAGSYNSSAGTCTVHICDVDKLADSRKFLLCCKLLMTFPKIEAKMQYFLFSFLSSFLHSSFYLSPVDNISQS